MVEELGARYSSFVVWIPMLDGDERPAAERVTSHFPSGVPQFWDGRQAFGKEVSRSIGEPTEVAWDIYLFYPADVEWPPGGNLPPPSGVLAQIGLGDGTGVVGSKGLLPPKGDQTLLPPFLEGRAEIVGTEDELASLLRQVATR
jgi:hypothetical protein